MRKGDVRIGFGIMGGFNQAQAHAQFVAHVADFRPGHPAGTGGRRFSKPTFTGLDVFVEETVPATTRRGLAARGHDVVVVPARSHTFGYGQAVMSNGTGVHFGASEPRHDGAAIPEPTPFE
jgi:gamma-glutamyltranspeptidase/glutathione hydrolase